MTDKLIGVHPDLCAAVLKVIAAMRVLGFEMRVTDGIRTVAQQQALFAQGRTEPGAIVTKADGVRKLSNHQVKPGEDFGRAVDCTFWVGGLPTWADDLPWDAYGECAKSQGLRWGGDFFTPDRPHVELP